MELRPGKVIAEKYRLERRLAQGGMGAVWLATHLGLERNVALKFERTERATKESSRLEREARAAAALRSPFVVSVIDFGFADGVGFLVMEYLEGEDLAVLLERERFLDPNEAVAFVRQAALGVRAVHDAGFIHRDIKPSNLFVVRRESPPVLKVLDFGIAKATNQSNGIETDTGLVLGSAAFMSPEQARGQKLGPPSDLWSLAAVLFRALSGRTPFLGENPTDLIVQICSEDPPRIGSLTDLPEIYDRFFERALARDPNLRDQSVDEFLVSLGALDGNLPKANENIRSSPRIGGREEETAPLSALESSGKETPGSSSAPSRMRFVVAGLTGALLAGILSAVVKRPDEPALEEPPSAPVLPTSSRNEPNRESLDAELSPPRESAEKTSVPSLASPPRRSRKISSPSGSSSARVAPDPVFGLPTEMTRP